MNWLIRQLNLILLYKIYLEDRYGEDYVDLGHPFAVHILTKNLDTSYLGKILKDKQKKMELTLNIRFTNQANKIYQPLNKHDIYNNKHRIICIWFAFK